MTDRYHRNQDVPRFANHTADMSRAMNVAAFVVMYDGIPIIYQGQEQHLSGGTGPYTNREPLWEHGFNVFHPMYQHISTLNFLRKQAISNDNKYTTSLSSVSLLGNSTLLMAKGSKGKQVSTLLSNAGSASDELTAVIDMSDTGYSSRTEMTEVLSCRTYTVASNDSLVFAIPAGGEPAVFYSSSALNGSTLCGTTGERYASSVMTTITQTTYTSAVGSSATVMVSTATVPVVASEITSTAAATQSPSSAVALRSGNSFSAWSLMATLAAANGILGIVIGGSW